MAAPGVEVCFTNWGSLVVPGGPQPSQPSGCEVDRMCVGVVSGPAPAVLTTPHMSLSREVSLTLSLSCRNNCIDLDNDLQ